MNKPDETRESVSKAYARAATTARKDCCCGPTADEVAAAPADYDRQDLAELLYRCGKLADVLERAYLGHPRLDVSSAAQRAER